MFHNFGVKMDEIIRYMLREDEGFGDITSNALIPENKIFYAKLITKDDGILAGIEIISSKKDGDEISKGDILLEIEGNARKILLLERTALNLLMRMSGVASVTNRIVSKVHDVNPNIRVAGTRKTAPALQKYDKLAISIGGGDPHRSALDDMILIKDNHIAVVGSVKKALELAKENNSFSKKIEIEVESTEDAIIACENGADIVMFDNMSPEEAKNTLNALEEKDLRKDVLIEISGGITEDNILDYAPLDVDIISLGSITHQASSLNFSLDMD